MIYRVVFDDGNQFRDIAFGEMGMKSVGKRFVRHGQLDHVAVFCEFGGCGVRAQDQSVVCVLLRPSGHLDGFGVR